MGIPVYFKNLINDYNDICFSQNNKLFIDNLLFDLNCLIHPCCRGETDELQMYQKIVESIVTIVNVVNPQNIVYIAIDGPCPKQKMHQQRSRRFKSSKENKIWDTNAITPGTKFMEHLEKYINKHLKLNIKWILDSSNNPGEGEHKLYQYIKDNKLNNNVIYGLDADLIMLGILSPSTKTYLLRERTEYNIENLESEYIYLHINNLKTCVINSIKPSTYQYTDNQLIYDYILLCFFLGNDFVQHTPSINIRYNGLEDLLDVYKKLQIQYKGAFFLVDINSDDLIKKSFLLEYINELSKNEDNRILHILKIRDKQENKFKHIYNKSKNKEEVEVHKPIIDRDNEKAIFKDIKYWKTNYYMYNLFHSLYNPSFDTLLEDGTNNLCRLYLESIYWTLHYYIKGCTSFTWHNPYNFAPSLVDIYQYYRKNSITIQKNDYKYTPLEQLQYVLPTNSHYLVSKIDSNSYMYPIDFKESYVLKRYLWESVPRIPY
jgi:5'-3' exoribonuclease 2